MLTKGPRLERGRQHSRHTSMVQLPNLRRRLRPCVWRTIRNARQRNGHHSYFNPTFYFYTDKNRCSSPNRLPRSNSCLFGTLPVYPPADLGEQVDHVVTC